MNLYRLNIGEKMIRALIIGACVFSVAYGIKGRTEKIMKILGDKHDSQVKTYQKSKN